MVTFFVYVAVSIAYESICVSVCGIANRHNGETCTYANEKSEQQSYLDLSVDTPIAAEENKSAPAKANRFNLVFHCACSSHSIPFPFPFPFTHTSAIIILASV